MNISLTEFLKIYLQTFIQLLIRYSSNEIIYQNRAINKLWQTSRSIQQIFSWLYKL